MDLRLTYGPWGETVEELCAAGRAAEAAGATAVWVPELHRSATIVAAALCGSTGRAQVGTAVALAFSRSPLATALEALDLDELSAGRFVLGLGTGTRRVVEDWHGRTWDSPVAHLRQTVGVIRAVIEGAANGTDISVDGEWERIALAGWARPFTPARSTIPVYLAAMGPDMTALAGEIADGWISHELTSIDFLRRRAMPALARGLSRGGRERKSLDVVASLCCAIGSDRRQARRNAAGLVGFYASVRTYADFFAFHGFEAAHRAAVDMRRSGAPPGGLAEVVPDAMVDVLCAAGDRDEVRARLAEMSAVVDTVKLTPPTHGLAPEETRAAQSGIIELIGELGGHVGAKEAV